MYSPNEPGGSMRSQIILTIANSGTAINAPGTPHSHAQKIIQSKTITGLSIRRRPMASGKSTYCSEHILLDVFCNEPDAAAISLPASVVRCK